MMVRGGHRRLLRRGYDAVVVSTAETEEEVDTFVDEEEDEQQQGENNDAILGSGHDDDDDDDVEEAANRGGGGGGGGRTTTRRKQQQYQTLSSRNSTTTEDEGNNNNNKHEQQQALQKEEEEKKNFPNDGVRLSWILNVFVPSCGGRESLRGKTTEQVLQEITKPRTKHLQCSYCQMLLKQQQKDYNNKAAVTIITAEPNVFVSHAFSYSFLDALDALANHLLLDGDDDVEEDADNTNNNIFVWWDLFSINQHIGEGDSWSFEWLSTTFKSAVGTIGRVVMVMSPWHHPLPYTRAWCVFEAYCAIETGASFEIALNQIDQAQFVEDYFSSSSSNNSSDRGLLSSSNNNDVIVDKMLSNLRAHKSQCRDEKDRDKIFQAIRSTTTMHQLDGILFERYRTWAANAMEEALATRQQELGEDHHPDVLNAMTNLASLYSSQGKHDKAFPLYSRCLELRTSTLGEDHVDTTMSMRNLAWNYLNVGDHERAEPLLKTCVRQLKNILGKEHPNTILILKDYARCALLKAGVDGQKWQCRQAVEAWRVDKQLEQLGLGVGRRFAVRAVNLFYREVLEKQKECLGVDHPDTLSTIHDLAVFYTRYFPNLFWKKKALHWAVKHLCYCYHKRTITLGETHLDTISSMYEAAYVYMLLSQYDKAEPLFVKALEQRKVQLGEDHPITKTSLFEVGNFYLRQKRYREAEELHHAFLKQMRFFPGENDPSTLAAMETVENLHRGMKKSCFCFGMKFCYPTILR